MSFRLLKHYPNEGQAYSFDIAQACPERNEGMNWLAFLCWNRRF